MTFAPGTLVRAKPRNPKNMFVVGLTQPTKVTRVDYDLPGLSFRRVNEGEVMLVIGESPERDTHTCVLTKNGPLWIFTERLVAL